MNRICQNCCNCSYKLIFNLWIRNIALIKWIFLLKLYFQNYKYNFSIDQIVWKIISSALCIERKSLNKNLEKYFYNFSIDRAENRVIRFFVEILIKLKWNFQMKVLKMNLLKNFEYRDSTGIIIEPTSGTRSFLNNFQLVRFRVVHPGTCLEVSLRFFLFSPLTNRAAVSRSLRSYAHEQSPF